MSAQLGLGGDNEMSDKMMLTLADLQVLATIASRNDTHHAFQAVALEWCGKADAEIARLRTAQADLAMMLKTCAWALRRGSSPDLGERALELLKKHGFLGTPLRDETLDEAGAAAAALYDRWTGKA